jgi:predicted RNA binding protein YcfA (HicA-like mRNA interferase family)
MSASDKLLGKICRNPRGVRFEEACKAAEFIGFVPQPKRGTSHRIFKRPGEITQLNFQDRNGKIATYQSEQLIVMIEKYRNSQ